MNNPIEINALYKPLYTSSKRYFLITGGRASLKSTTVHDFIARLTYESGNGVLFTRYTMTSAEKSIIPEFEIALDRMGAKGDFHITKNEVTNKRTGSFIYFSGIKTSSGDQTANLKSLAGITTWVVEEGEDFKDEKTFDSIDDSVRTSGKQNRVIWIQNPSTREHFIYKRWIEPNSKQILIEGLPVTLSNLPNVEHIHSTYRIATKHLSEGWIDKANTARDKMLQMPLDERTKSWYYSNYIGGWLEKAEGAIFSSWSEGQFPEHLPHAFGLDFGFFPDPLAVIRVAVNGKQIYLREEVYATQLSTSNLINQLRPIVKNGLVICDTNENRTFNELFTAGINAQKAHKREIVTDIREIQGYELIVDPNSHNLKKELNNYKWNDKKSSIPMDSFNHLLDAMRYAFVRLVHGTGQQSVF